MASCLLLSMASVERTKSMGHSGRRLDCVAANDDLFLHSLCCLPPLWDKAAAHALSRLPSHDTFLGSLGMAWLAIRQEEHLPQEIHLTYIFKPVSFFLLYTLISDYAKHSFHSLVP